VNNGSAQDLGSHSRDHVYVMQMAGCSRGAAGRRPGGTSKQAEMQYIAQQRAIGALHTLMETRGTGYRLIDPFAQMKMAQSAQIDRGTVISSGRAGYGRRSRDLGTGQEGVRASERRMSLAHGRFERSPGRPGWWYGGILVWEEGRSLILEFGWAFRSMAELGLAKAVPWLSNGSPGVRLERATLLRCCCYYL
jgi:hypothetical protein